MKFHSCWVVCSSLWINFLIGHFVPLIKAVIVERLGMRAYVEEHTIVFLFTCC